MSMHQDLIVDIFKKMSMWGSPPDEKFYANVLSEYHAEDECDVKRAFDIATRLQELVDTGARIYYTNSTDKRPTVLEYLKSGLPNLSDDAYFLAERRLMFMAIK